MKKFTAILFKLFISPITILLISLIAATGIISSCISNSESSPPGSIQCDDVTIPVGMKCIPGGEFIRGSNKTTIDETSYGKIKDEYPIMKISVSTFLLDTYEVTFSQYQNCVKKGGCTPARPNYRGYDDPKMPMLGLNWYQARAYCTWAGKRLPTEAEFEKAARGPKGEIFPWGNEEPDCSKAIIQQKGKKGCGTGKTWDVGSKPANRYGLYDIAGNSWEWVQDWYSRNYKACGKDCEGKDPKGPCKGKDRCPGHRLKVIRGGSWWWDGIHARGANRRSHFPKNNPYHHFGFRCAKSIQ